MNDRSGLSPYRVQLTLSTLSKIFSRRHIEIYFLTFLRKQDLTFHANCLQNPMIQFACNVKSYLQMETICMKCQILFSGNNYKYIIKSSNCRLSHRIDISKQLRHRSQIFFFLLFFQKIGMIFHANCLEFAWNVKVCFLRLIIIKISIICRLQNLPKA